MCVIFVVSDERPSPLMVSQAWQRNDHGGGVAWREGGEVHWKKDLKLIDMQDLCAELPLPYVAHFRIASQGGIRGDLCHPFEVTHNPSTATKGRTKESVLFHNGDWNQWRSYMLNAAVHSGYPLPKGRWSDSRAMAWLGAVYGPGFFELVGEKLVLFGPDTLDVFGFGWKDVNKVLCSNDFFVPVPVYQGQHVNNNYSQYWGTKICKFGRCTKPRMDDSDYCEDHPPKLVNTKGETITPGGSSTERTPFEKRLLSQVEEAPLSILAQAETAHRQGTISRSFLKIIRRLSAKAEQKRNSGRGQQASTATHTKAPA